MIDANELRRLAQAVREWSNCNQAWLDQSEDAPDALVGHIDEDGNTYPVATVDCGQYHAAHQSLPLAKFIAAASPVAITELLDRLETTEKELEKERLRLAACSVAALGYFEGCAQEYRSAALDDVLKLRAKIVEMEKQALVCRVEDVAHAGSLLPASSVPEGFKLVPIEPTDAMLKAAQKEWLNDPLRRTTTMWKAMLAATKGQ